MEEFENMSVTMKVVGAAGAGAFAAWILEGDYSWRGFTRLLGAMIIAGFMAIAAVSLVPFLSSAPELAKIGIAGVVGGFSADIFKRWTRAAVRIDAGPLHMESEGKDEKEKLP